MAKTLVLLYAVAFIAGCCACKSSTEESAVLSGPPAYTITIGAGGGVTGNVTGVKIDTDGNVVSWSALPNQDFEPVTIGRLPQDRLNLLYTIIEEDSLMSFHFVETGNMTSFLTLEGNGQNHRLRWRGIETDTAAAPIPLRRFIDQLNKSYDAMESKEP